MVKGYHGNDSGVNERVYQVVVILDAARVHCGSGAIWQNTRPGDGESIVTCLQEKDQISQLSADL